MAGSGKEIEHAGDIVTDEASFIEEGLPWHADGISRQCTGNDASFGGIPMLLAGDIMQKGPPNSQGGPRFKGLVDRATGDLSKTRTGTAEAKGLGLLADMPLCKLERPICTLNDQQFTDWQWCMRRTGGA